MGIGEAIQIYQTIIITIKVNDSRLSKFYETTILKFQPGGMRGASKYQLYDSSRDDQLFYF